MIALLLTTMLATNDPLQALVTGMRDMLAKSGLERKTTEAGDVYWTGGKGAKTIVLLHGANDQAGTWFAVAPELAKKYRLIIPDLAGHGESAPSSGPLPLPMIVERFAGILDRENAGKVTLVGNSMGGWVSMLYAFDHPDRVERLVLEDSSGMAWDLTGVPLFPKTREEMRAAMRAVNGPDDKTPDAILDALVARKDPPMSRVSAILESLVDARLSKLTMPVTLIWGRHDGLLSIKYAETLKSRIPHSKLVVIEDAAHIPHRQQPQKFIECLTATF